MRKIEELKNVLGNEEMHFMELDKAMVENGFYSVRDDGVTEDIRRDKNVVYTGVESGEREVIVTFEVTIDGGEDEGPESFYLRVTKIEKF